MTQGNSNSDLRIVVVGGGAAGFFFAANVSALCPRAKVSIIEKSVGVLHKVRISGGGRCNVTHDCEDPEILSTHYPRGRRELLGPFNRFGPRDTVDWFESRGVQLKTEADGRIFPRSDNSQSIIDCLRRECNENGVHVRMGSKLVSIEALREGEDGFNLELSDGDVLSADRVFMATGSSKPVWHLLQALGFEIVDPVASLFTFQIKDQRLEGLAGISLDRVIVSAEDHSFKSEGPLMITHKGLSGPAVLKLSSHLARHFHSLDYKSQITVDFRPDLSREEFDSWRQIYAKKLIGNHQLMGLPKRLAQRLVETSNLDSTRKIASCSKQDLATLFTTLKSSRFDMLGQNRFKEEFVTAGGIDLKEIDFSKFSSKRMANFYFAGEILNIDGVTGGFNFQSAWTGAYIAANSIKES